MPQCVIDPLRIRLQELFEPLPVQIVKRPEVGRAVDSTLHELRPRVRKAGYISPSDPEILSLWWNIMAIALENQPGMEVETEAFFQTPQNTQRFCRLIQEAASISAFVSQLNMADPKSVLVRKAQRFRFVSWTTLVSSFNVEKPSDEVVNNTLQRIFYLACRMIPASSENQSIGILGKPTDDVVLFRTVVDAITLRLMQLRRPVPDTMTHYPICKALKQATCAGLDLDDAALARSCQELDVVRRLIQSKIDFSQEFCQAMKQAELPLMERSECNENERNFSLLKDFFVEYMTQQLESSAIKSQWSTILEKQALSYGDPKVFPLAENALASIVHEASIRFSEIDTPSAPSLAKVAEDVYKTMCKFVDYMIVSTGLKVSNVCNLMAHPPDPLLQVLSDILEAHMVRIKLGRFALSMRPISSLTLHQILDSKDLPKHPGSAMTVGVLRFITSYFKKDKTSEDVKGPTAYHKVRKGFSDIFKLIVDRLYKLKPRLAAWQKKVVQSLRLLVNEIVRLVLRSAKQMTYANKGTVVLEQVQYDAQMELRRRLQSHIEGTPISPQGTEDESTEAGSSPSMVEMNDGRKAGAQPLVPFSSRLPSVFNHVALVEASPPTKSEPKQGQGMLGLVKLLASLMLSDIPRLVSGVVPAVLPSVWFSVSGVLRVKKSVVGSVKSTAEKVCVRVLDSTVLPSLISTNSLVPEALIRTQLILMARNIHLSVMSEASKVESDLKTARRDRGFLGLGVLLRGLVFAAAAQLEDLLQDATFQDKVVTTIHRRVRDLSGLIQTAFKKYLVSEVICQSVEVVIDAVADLLNEKRDDLMHSLLEIVEMDALGRLSVFLESSVWRLMKLLLDGEGALNLMSDILSQVGLMGAAKDTVRALWGWFFGSPKAPTQTNEQ